MKRLIYILKDPRTNDVVYVGETGDIKERYLSHLFGKLEDSYEKRKWTEELKKEKLKPIIEIIDYAENKRDAMITESNYIKHYKSLGYVLFNRVYLNSINQYDRNGKLINTFVDARDIKEKLGLHPHIGRGTDNGYLFTKGDFDKSFFDKIESGKKVRMKKVEQIDIEGNTVNVFDGVRVAGRITSIDHRSIAAVAGGSKIRKTAGGYKWRYI